jgi:anaerobic selenocysteine-containing dehydrogenase
MGMLRVIIDEELYQEDWVRALVQRLPPGADKTPASCSRNPT